VLRAAGIALALVVVQFGVAAAMVLGHLPPGLRSLHEAVGVGIWLACFSFAYLARRAAGSRSRDAEADAVSLTWAAAVRRSPIAHPPSPIAGATRK
jgi:hypothetical protein